MPQLSLHTPLGDLTVSEDRGRIVSLDSGWGRDQEPTPLLLRARTALQRYFDGENEAFDLPLAPPGTPYQQRAWHAMRAIPAGTTLTYGELAERLRTVARALGQACARNPIPILIPCHRVVSGAGAAEYYSFADGPSTKAWLLALERRQASLPGLNALSVPPATSGPAGT